MLELAAWIQPFEIKPAEIFCLRMLKQKLWLTFYLRRLFTQEPFNDNGNSNLVNDFKHWLEHFRKDYFWGGWESLGHQRQLRGNHFWGDLQGVLQPAKQPAPLPSTAKAVPTLGVGTSQRLLEATCRHQQMFLSYTCNWALVTSSSHI